MQEVQGQERRIASFLESDDALLLEIEALWESS
jgi:hypothetical protein